MFQKFIQKTFVLSSVYLKIMKTSVLLFECSQNRHAMKRLLYFIKGERNLRY